MDNESCWESEKLYTTGDAYFTDLMKAIEQASQSIEFETYIFESGVLADRLSRCLIAAAQRGVKVRMIVDGLGSPRFGDQYWPQLKAAGVRVRFFRSFPWILRRLPGDSDSLFLRFLMRIRRLNRGLHRKFCIVDHQELWSGSFNVSDVHLTEIYGSQAWKDMGVAVRGPDVRSVRRAFHRAFLGWRALNWPTRSPRLLMLNDSYIHKRRTRLQSVRQIRNAKERVWISTPYFVPIGSIYRLLKEKAQQGMDIRVMIPRKNDVWIMRWISSPVLKKLSTYGVKVFVYEPRFSHQKILIADDWITVGSTNINHRSFLHDLELDIVITHNTNREAIVKGYVADQEQAHPFDNSDLANLPLWKQVLSQIFALMRNWS